MDVEGTVSRVQGVVYGIGCTVAGFGAFLFLFLGSSVAPPSVNHVLVSLTPFTQRSVGSFLPMETGGLAAVVVFMPVSAVTGSFGLYMFYEAVFEEDFSLIGT